MRYKSFEIRNYKAIENININLEDQNLYPIIGLNESGKSSILQAIFAFDCHNDKFYNGEYRDYKRIKNRFLREEIYPEVEVTIVNLDTKNTAEQLDKIAIKIWEKSQKEIMNVIEGSRWISLSMDSLTYEDFHRTMYPYFLQDVKMRIEILTNEINKIFEKETEIKIKRIFTPHGNYYEILGVNLNALEIDTVIYRGAYEIKNLIIPNKKILDAFSEVLIENLNKIIYIDDFKDKIPRAIGENTDWYIYICQIIKECGINIEKFLSNDYEDLQTDISAIADTLNNDITRLWNEMHQLDGFEEEFKTVEIQLHYENGYFKFLIKDLRKKDYNGKLKSIFFPIDERSKGFQWFFNFFIKTRYNWKYNNDKEYGSIILLDEPGVYLHTEFQKELAKVLREVSLNKNKVFYSTHLENLVDPEVIPPKLIYIVKRENEKVEISKYNDCKDDTSELGSLAPLINAFKLKSYPITFRKEKIILTEGPSEQSFFKLLQEGDFLVDEIIVIPGAGCANLSPLISLISGFSDKYTLLLDGDAKRYFDKYEREFGEEESKKWILHYIMGSEKSELEDYYSEGMKKVLRDYVNPSKVDEKKFDYKSAVQKFYYGADSNLRNQFLYEVKEETRNENSNINILIKRIYKILDIIN